jgi:hypothetical protein
VRSSQADQGASRQASCNFACALAAGFAGGCLGNDLLIDVTRCWTVVTVQIDPMIGVAKGRNRLPGWR